MSSRDDWLTDEAFGTLGRYLKAKQYKYLEVYLRFKLPWLQFAVANKDSRKIYEFIEEWREHRRTNSSVPHIGDPFDFFVFVDELCTKWMKEKGLNYSWITILAVGKIRDRLNNGDQQYIKYFLDDKLSDVAAAIRDLRKDDVETFFNQFNFQSGNHFFQELTHCDLKSRLEQLEEAKDAKDKESLHKPKMSLDWLAPQYINGILEDMPDLARYLDNEEPEVAWAVQNQGSEEIENFVNRMAQSRPDLPIIDSVDTFVQVLDELESVWKPEESSYAWLTLDVFKTLGKSIHDSEDLSEFVTRHLPDLSQSIQKQTEEEIPHFIGLLAQNKLWRIKSVKDLLIKLWDIKESTKQTSIVKVSPSADWLTSEILESWAQNLKGKVTLEILDLKRPDVILAIKMRDVLWMRQFVRQLEYWSETRILNEKTFIECLSKYLVEPMPVSTKKFLKRVMFRCHVNGIELDGLVDTGAISIISLQHLLRCRIDINKVDTNLEELIGGLQDIGGVQLGKVYDIPLSIKGIAMPDIHLAVMDPSELEFFIIGRDYLRTNNVEVFCKERMISIPFKDRVQQLHSDDDPYTKM